MKNKACHFSVLCWILGASVLAGCDPFQEDAIPAGMVVIINKSAINYYILPNSSAIIDQRALVSSSFEKIGMKVSEHPNRGTLSPIGNLFLKYTPSPSFNEQVHGYGAGMDQFSIAFVQNGKTLAAQTITVNMIQYADGFPCSLYAVEDTASTISGTIVSIRSLLNDRLCGIKVSDVRISISLNPKHGQAVAQGQTIVYTPEAGFEGIDEFVYRISTTNTQVSTDEEDLISYGLITINVSE